MSATINNVDVNKASGVSLKVDEQEGGVYSVSVNIDEVRQEHQGEVVFVAKNKKGSDTCKVMLNVRGMNNQSSC